MHAARAVREARRRAGLSQVELARRTRMHVQVVNRIERGLVDPKFGTVMTLLEATGSDLAVTHRRGMHIDREPIRDLLRMDPRSRLEPEHLAALDELRRRGVRFVLLGEAAIRLHGGPSAVAKVEISLGPDHLRESRLRRAARSGDLSCVVIRADRHYLRLREDAEPLPWLPPPKMRILNDWIDAPKGFLASIADLSEMADSHEQELLAAVQEEVALMSPGFRVYRRADW